MHVLYTAAAATSSEKGKALNCSKCNGTMTEGFILELAPGVLSANTFQTVWIEDPPQKDARRRVDIRAKRKYYIASYRCESCGLLEEYARVPVQL